MAGVAEIWFTADSHIFHESILNYCNRPFSTVEEMDEELISRWNSVVAKGDLVYHLGDFCFTWGMQDADKVNKLVSRLHGSIQLIWGNHDRKVVKKCTKFAWQGYYKEIVNDKKKIVLFHYPILNWHHCHHGYDGAWNLCGHTHCNLKIQPNILQLDVGVDCWDFYPISLERVRKIMRDKLETPEYYI